MNVNEKYLAHISVASVCALLFIWVLPNTIALRHALLGVGFLSGTFLIKENWNRFYPFKAPLVPLYSIACLFVWVGIHYYYFSLNPLLELSEIKGLWIRTFAGFVMAIGFGISLRHYVHLRTYFYFSIFFVPIINVLAYVFACYLHGGFIRPNEFVFFLYAKIETAYFGALAAAVAVANIIYLVTKKSEKKNYLEITLYFFGLFFVLISAFVSSTKNGIAIAMALCLLLVFIVLMNSLLNSVGQKKLSLVIALFVLLLAGGVWQEHQSFASKGWGTIFEDMKVAIDIDSNTQWQRKEGAVEAPLNALGMPAALNTYSRFAYAMVGIRLISQYPLGYGSINQSFNGLQSIADIPHEHQGQVHSGWLDFGLAFGVPGLLLLFSSILGAMYFAIRRFDQLNLVALMICATLIPFCLIAEMSYKQYFESWVFFIALAATLVAFSSIYPENSKRS